MSKTGKPKFSLAVSPTFKAPVEIPIHGGKSAEIVFTFKHRTRDEFTEFMDGLKTEDGAEGPKDTDVLLDIASGWDLDEPFDAKSLEDMVQRFMGSAQKVIHTYCEELTGARAKN
ncbi:MAG TPA: phage tail assembly chaperone [Telluria sp.]|jgi:hypothetical protein